MKTTTAEAVQWVGAHQFFPPPAICWNEGCCSTSFKLERRRNQVYMRCSARNAHTKSVRTNFCKEIAFLICFVAEKVRITKAEKDLENIGADSVYTG